MRSKAMEKLLRLLLVLLGIGVGLAAAQLGLALFRLSHQNADIPTWVPLASYTGMAVLGGLLLMLLSGRIIRRVSTFSMEMQKEFDKMYGGHEIFDPSIVDEAIETVAKVVAGTDDKCERPGIMGGTVFYAAEKVKDGYARADGKHFNMSYRPDKVTAPDETRQVIKLPEKKD